MSRAAALVLQGFRALCSLTLLERLWLSRFGLLGRLPGSVGTCLKQALPVLHVLRTQAVGAYAKPSAPAHPEHPALAGTGGPLLDQPGGSTGTDWQLHGAHDSFCMGRLMCPACRDFSRAVNGPDKNAHAKSSGIHAPWTHSPTLLAAVAGAYQTGHLQGSRAPHLSPQHAPDRCPALTVDGCSLAAQGAA